MAFSSSFLRARIDDMAIWLTPAWSCCPKRALLSPHQELHSARHRKKATDDLYACRARCIHPCVLQPRRRRGIRKETKGLSKSNDTQQ